MADRLPDLVAELSLLSLVAELFRLDGSLACAVSLESKVFLRDGEESRFKVDVLDGDVVDNDCDEPNADDLLSNDDGDIFVRDIIVDELLASFELLTCCCLSALFLSGDVFLVILVGEPNRDGPVRLTLGWSRFDADLLTITGLDIGVQRRSVA